jgi:hypothetical protein
VVAAALAALCCGAPAAQAAAPTPRVTLSVVTRDQSALRAGGPLVLRVGADRPGRVTVKALAARKRIGRTRSLRFRHAGARRVTVALTRAGKRLAATCGRLLVTATARAYPARRVRRSPSAFTGDAGPVVRAARTLRADPSGCYRLGMATRSINPAADGKFEGQTVYLGGYGIGGPPASAGRPATGILGDGAQVRAVSVSDGKRRVAVADMEEQGWFAATKDGPYGIVDIRRQVEKATGGAVKAQQVIVQSDHSHSGADTIGVWGGVPTAYRAYIMRQTVAALVAAVRAERPGTLFYGTAPGADLLSNQFDYDAANKVLDSDVRVLQARDPDGTPFATLLNFSAHATVLGASNTKMTGDWPTRANAMMEKRFGGRAATMVGTLGRTQPKDRGCADKSLPEKSDASYLCALDGYAGRVVDRAAQAADAAKPLGGGAPFVDARSYLIQDPSTNAVILGLDYAGDPLGAPINRALTPPWLAGNVLGTVTGSARIGDVLLSVVPGEAYPQIPLKVRELVPGMRGYMTAGLGDDQLGYLIAPFEAYPEPIRRTFFSQRGDEVSPIDNDNYAFNVSPTIGERVTCSLLRGAGELAGKATAYRSAYDRCGLFPNDLTQPAGADVR